MITHWLVIILESIGIGIVSGFIGGYVGIRIVSRKVGGKV